MTQSPVVTAEVVNMLPILIIDKEGSIGIALYGKLRNHLQVVLAGGREPSEAKNLLFLPYGKELPVIPHDPYSHIFFIPHTSKELEGLLPVLQKKAEEDESRIFLLLSQKIQAEKGNNLNVFLSKKITVVVMGDVFGENREVFKEERVESLIITAKNLGKIQLSNMGLDKLYPIAFSDMIREILRVAFAVNASKKIYFAGKKEPITELAIAHALQKINPLLKIDFHNHSHEEKEKFPVDAVSLLDENYPEIEEIENYFKSLPLSTEAKLYEKKESDKKEARRHPYVNIQKFFILSGIFIITVLLLPFLVVASAGGGTYFLLKWSVADLEKGNVQQAKSTAQNAQALLNVAQNAQIMLSGELGVINQQGNINKFAEKIQMGKQIASSLILGAETIQNVKDIIKGQKKVSSEDLSQIINNGKSVALQLEKIKGEAGLSAKEEQELTQISSFAQFFNILDSVPNLVGMKGPKTYLILFQNNTELRPGGGFIGSYGLLTLDKAAVSSFTIHDVYDADGQLKGHIEPPFAIRRYLPSVHMYLRDSNFDVDFTKDAYMAAFLLQQETGQQVDGVIGVDLSFVQGLLKGLGSVYVPDYNETVTADNMFLLTENHAEKNFFPGSTQKKDFLRSLFASIQNRLTQGDAIGSSFVSQLIESIAQKHMMFAFSDPATQELFTANNLSSALWDDRDTQENTINDFLGINEANLGVNKVNYWINREVSQSVTVAQNGSVNGEVTLKLTNTSKGTWPAGEYKSYLRFILPNGAVLNAITINGQKQTMVPAITDFLAYEAKGFTPPVGLEVEKAEENGKTIYGFLVMTLPLSTRTVTIEYTYAQKIDITKPVFGYNFDFFKQPGTEVYPMTFSLTYPSTFKLLKGPSFIQTDEANVNFVSNIAKDMSFSMSFTKK